MDLLFLQLQQQLLLILIESSAKNVKTCGYRFSTPSVLTVVVQEAMTKKGLNNIICVCSSKAII